MQLYFIVRKLSLLQSALFYRWNSPVLMYADVTVVTNTKCPPTCNTMLLIQINVLIMKNYLHPLSLIPSISYGN